MPSIPLETVLSVLGDKTRQYRAIADSTDNSAPEVRLENLRVCVELQNVATTFYAEFSGDPNGDDWNEVYNRYFS